MSSCAILALCGVAQKQWKILAFLQCAAWEPGQNSSEQVRTHQKPLKTLEKPRIPACWTHGASVGARWPHVAAGGFRRATCKNPWENYGFLLAHPGFQEPTSPPGQRRTEEDRGGQKPCKTLEISTIPRMSYLTSAHLCAIVHWHSFRFQFRKCTRRIPERIATTQSKPVSR